MIDDGDQWYLREQKKHCKYVCLDAPPGQIRFQETLPFTIFRQQRLDYRRWLLILFRSVGLLGLRLAQDILGTRNGI